MTGAETAAAGFAVAGSIVSVESHPTGHINDAWLVTTDRKRYLLQRLNPSVFPDPDAVMGNIVVVTQHLQQKGEPTLTLVPARDPIDSRWRMYEYIEGVKPHAVQSPDDAALVGHCFGRFHRVVADLDPGRLRVSLPGFHDPGRRVSQLEAAASTDPHGRLADVAADLDTLRTLHHAIDADTALAGLPTRVAHNDAKAANVLVGSTTVVVDLDTVMPGGVLWDLGDMVRSSTGTSDEATATVTFDAARHRTLVDAWLGEVDDLLTEAERAAVPHAGAVVTFEQAVRFLTDHINGDVYFRVTRSGQNLERARNQLQLLRSMVSTP